MDLPFSAQQFLDVFAHYNETYMPLQVVFYLLAILSLVLLIRKVPWASVFTNAMLAYFWIWMGGAYHWVMFTEINPAAWVFGGLFVLQGLLFTYATVQPQAATCQIRGGWMGALGWLFILYALVAYPVIGYLAGMRYPESITLGLPCPTTIFTFGLLMWTTTSLRKWLAVIPFIWALIGTTAAFKLGVYQDLGLGLAGLVTAGVLWFRKREKPALQ
jgi:hypothetical protein